MFSCFCLTYEYNRNLDRWLVFSKIGINWSSEAIIFMKTDFIVSIHVWVYTRDRIVNIFDSIDLNPKKVITKI